ncbi:MAG: hypothetical protein K6360_03450 [Deltaproteobacteria bacterium]
MTPRALPLAAILFIISFLMSACTLGSHASGDENPPPPLKIVYSGNTMGFLEPCPS